jgi:hypothetical protein
MSSLTHARHILTLLLFSYQCTSELKKLDFVHSLHCLNILLKYTTFSLSLSKITHKTSYHFFMSIHLLATMPAWTQYSSYALNFVKPVSLAYFESFEVPFKTSLPSMIILPSITQFVTHIQQNLLRMSLHNEFSLISHLYFSIPSYLSATNTCFKFI